MRRAERGIGIAIRRGQEEGTVMKPGDVGAAREQHRLLPSEIAPVHELHRGSYAVTDGVTDEQFDAALEVARVEGNLSRANVVRKVSGRLGAVARPGVPTERSFTPTGPLLSFDRSSAHASPVAQVSLLARGLVERRDFCALAGSWGPSWRG